MPLSFNAVDLCVVTINEKPWTLAKEVCRALEYKKGRARDVLKRLMSIKNKQQKHELEERVAAAHYLEWPKNSQPVDYCINEEGMYELLFLSQQPRAKDLRRHCFNVLFPRVRQQLSNTSHAMKIEGLTSRFQTFKITNEVHEQEILRLNE